MMMQHERNLKLNWLSSTCSLIISFVLLFSFFPDRAAALTSQDDVYVGSDADFFYDKFASVYSSDEQSEEYLMQWFYQCYNDCHVLNANLDKAMILFLPDDYYYAYNDYFVTDVDRIRSYTVFEYMYVMSFASGSMELTKVNFTNVTYDSSGGYYQAYLNAKTLEYLVGNLSVSIKPVNEVFYNGTGKFYSNVNFTFYARRSSTATRYDVIQNIKRLTTTPGLTYQIDSDDSSRVQVSFLLLGLLQEDINLTFNMVSVNRWGTEIPFSYTYSDKGLAGNVSDGENISIFLGQYIGYSNTIENLTAAAPVTAVNIYIDSVVLTFTNSDGEQTTFYQDKDLYLVIGDSSLINSTPDYDYDDKYDGPEDSYNTGIDSGDIAGRYNLTPIEVSSDGSTVENIPDWADVVFVRASSYYSASGTRIYNNVGDTDAARFLLSHSDGDYVTLIDWNYSSVTNINSNHVTTLYYDCFFDEWTDLLGDLSYSYDVIIFVGYDFTFYDFYHSASDYDYYSYSFSTHAFASERLYKRSVCYYMTDGFTMMGDYLYDISQENNAIYSVLYSGLSDKSSPLVQMRDNSITQLAVLNNILSSIDKIQPSCSFEPYDDTAVLSGIWAAVNAINNQEVFSDVTILGKLEQILNTLNGSAGFDSTAILDKIDEAITAIKNIKINVEQNIYQEAQKSILDRVLDILQQIIESIISLVTKLVEILLDFVARFLNDVLDLFEYIKKLFTEGLDGDYMTVFNSPDPEVNARITGAAAYLSSVSFLFSCLPKVVQLLIVLSVFMSVTLIIMKGVAFNG